MTDPLRAVAAVRRLAGRPRSPLVAGLALSAALSAQAVTADDHFLAGYASALLEREYSLPTAGLSVAQGALRCPDLGLGRLETEQIRRVLSALPGIRSVTFGDDPAAATTPAVAVRTTYLTPGRLFEPLLADPRWPHFHASYHSYTQYGSASFPAREIEQVGSVGFGETLALLRQRGAVGWRWEAGVQAGVFAIFDLDSDSKDLINADYVVGPYGVFRYLDTAVLARVFHQSSHLGDEYLLREQITGSGRVNLSYEAADLLLSHEGPWGLRAYGGGSHLLSSDPPGLSPWATQYGLEWRAPWRLAGLGDSRPIVAVDFQNRQENDWSADASLRAGLLFDDLGRFSQRMAAVVEFYDGRSPNGQFYADRIQYVGIGLHFYF